MRRPLLLAALSATVMACAGDTPKRAIFEFEVIDGIAACTHGDPTEVRCGPLRASAPATDGRWGPASSGVEYVRTPGQVSLAGPVTDRLSWLDFGANRDTGTRTRVVMDRDGGKLLESRFDELAFNSQRVSGTIELPSDDECPCQVGRFELAFQASGPDGVLDTADDQHRRLSRGRIRTDGRPFCHQRAVLPVVPGELNINRVACPVPTTNGQGSGGSTTPSDQQVQQSSLWGDGFEHPECVFFGWDDEETYQWNGGMEDWDAEEAQDNGWYDESWDDSPDSSDEWSDNWNEEYDWNDSTDGGWGDSGSSSGGGSSDGSWSWGDDSGGSGDDGSWDGWDDDDDGWDWGDSGDDGGWDDWGDDSGDDDYWDDDDGWGDE